MKTISRIAALLLAFLLAACSQDTGGEQPDGDTDAQDSDGGSIDGQDSPDGGDGTSDGDDATGDDPVVPDGDEFDGDTESDGGADGDGNAGDPGADAGPDGDGSAGDPGADESPDAGDSDPGCAGYASGVRVGTIDNYLLYELSGITASERNPDVLWSHNDGSDPKLYAIGTDSSYLGAYNLTGIQTHDWEDIAVGPGPEPGTTYVYVGDHGNNGRDRQRVWVHRVPEPDTSTATPPFDLDLSEGETFPLDYPDDRHDVETLLVDPQTGDVYLVTKAYEGPTILFRAAAPLVDDQPVTLEQMNTIDLGSTPELNLATGGDVNPAGDRIVIRTKLTAHVWERPSGTPFWEAFDAEPCTVGLQIELTGEAAGFDADGASFYTTQEWLNPPLYFYEYNF